MKKLFLFLVFATVTLSGLAQILHYDFSVVCETGQTLYYSITSEEAHTVTLTYPYSEENSFFQGNYYQNHPEPQGEIMQHGAVELLDGDILHPFHYKKSAQFPL